MRDAMLLAQQRAYPPDAVGRWELPGGRVEAGESDVDALRRECTEELGVEIVVGSRVGADVPLSPGTVLRVFDAVLADPAAEPLPVEHRAVRWLAADELAGIDWLPADRLLVPELERLLRTLAREVNVMERLRREGTVEGSPFRRVAVEPVDADGHDTTSLISRRRR